MSKAPGDTADPAPLPTAQIRDLMQYAHDLGFDLHVTVTVSRGDLSRTISVYATRAAEPEPAPGRQLM